MSKQKEYSELKKRALLAKKRMKMGYWQQLQKEKDEMLLKLSPTLESAQIVSEVQRARYIRDNYRSVNSFQAEKDEAMYQKVKQMLDEDEFTLNPIGRLVNKKEYDNMDEQSKQRYILELSKKFREFKERYYRERVGKSS